MSDDPFRDLREELLAAHRRRTGPVAVVRRLPRTPHLPSLGTLATAAVVIASLVLGVGFIVLVRGGGHERAIRQPQDARDLVGLFRRPQTAADRNARVLAQMRTMSMPGEGMNVHADTLRLGAAHAFGRVYFALGTPSATDPRVRSGVWRGDQVVTVMTSATGEPMGGSSGGDLAQLAQRGGSGSGGSSNGGASLTTWLFPDGVARVQLHFPRQQMRYGRVFPAPLVVTAPVADNTILLRLPRGAGDAAPDWIDWYDAGGKRIKRVTLYHAPATPILRPREDAASMEARKHPSAPNPVTVEPVSGSPQTTFTIAFRRLVTGTLGVRYRVDGPRRRSCTTGLLPPPDTISGFGVRGTINRYPIGPAPGFPTSSWCRGTYRVSVAIVGRNGAFPPFGAATFTVR